MHLQNQDKIKLKLSLFDYENLEEKIRFNILEKMLDLNLKIYEINYPELSKKDFSNLREYYSKIPYELTSAVDHLIKENKIDKKEEDKLKGIIEILKVDIKEKLKDLNKSIRLTPYLKKNLMNLLNIINNENFETIESIALLFITRNYLGDFQYKTKKFESGLSMDSSVKNLSLFKNHYYTLLGYTSGWMLESIDYELLSQKSNGIVNHLDYMEWFQNPRTRSLMSMDLEVKTEGKRHLIDVKNYIVSSKNGLKLSFHKELKDMSKNLTKSYVYNRESSYMYSFFDKKEQTIESYLIPFKVMKDFIKHSLTDKTIRTEERVIKISNNKFKEIFSEFKMDFENLNLNNFFTKKIQLDNSELSRLR